MVSHTAALQPETSHKGAASNGKRLQILDGARHAFLESGFDAASMNEIARIAGVSKGTLYVYFDSKEALFEALIRHDKRIQVEQICWPDEHAGDLRASLLDLGCRLLATMLEPHRIAELRTVIAVSAKFPAIGQAFYESGPSYGRKRLAAFLQQHAADAGLQIADHDRAAELFLDLCKSHVLLRAILSVGEPPVGSALEEHVAASVEMFLHAFRAR